MKEENVFLKMSGEEFDKFMCEKFPQLFQDRNKPMSETCMCWGFDVGKGWYKILFDLCEKLDYIREQTSIITVFDQIKEKFGGGRFYYHIDASTSKLDDKIVGMWGELIDSLVNRAEGESENTCAECGEKYFHDKICIGRWVYDLCKECLVSKKLTRHENVSEILAEQERKKNYIREMTNSLYRMEIKDLKNVEIFMSQFEEPC